MTPAILSKNHQGYLKQASQASAVNPEQFVTFQSKQRWRQAEKLINANGPGVASILFAVVGKKPEVRYHARLEAVVIDPHRGDEQTEKLLSLRLASTSGEGLWSEGGTLYAVSGCHELERAVPYSELFKYSVFRKTSIRQPISDDYKYGYAVVLDPLVESDTVVPPIAVDIAGPPPTTQVVVTRRIRDTALVRRLKASYQDHCQRCDTRLELPDGAGYSEGHHLRPLGGGHDGPDTEANMVVLCPNCHALFDMGAVVIRGETLTMKPDHRLDPDHVNYHNVLAKKRGAR